MFDPYNPDPYEWPYWPILADPAIRTQRPASQPFLLARPVKPEEPGQEPR